MWLWDLSPGEGISQLSEGPTWLHGWAPVDGGFGSRGGSRKVTSRGCACFAKGQEGEGTRKFLHHEACIHCRQLLEELRNMHLRISQAIFKPQGETVCKSTFKVKPRLVSHESTSSFTVLPLCPTQSWGSPALSVDVILTARAEAAPFDNQIIAGTSCSKRPSFSHFPNLLPVRPFSLSLTYPRSPARRVSVRGKWAGEAPTPMDGGPVALTMR